MQRIKILFRDKKSDRFKYKPEPVPKLDRPLTEKQLLILKLKNEGNSYASIGRMLGVSRQSVSATVKSIMGRNTVL